MAAHTRDFSERFSKYASMLMIRILTVIGLFWAPTGGGPGGQEALNRDKTQTQRKLKYLGPPASMN